MSIMKDLKDTEQALRGIRCSGGQGNGYNFTRGRTKRLALVKRLAEINAKKARAASGKAET